MREFDWNADADTIAQWQRETYALNFPDFAYTPDFAAAFKHDLRRAALDENNGLFVLGELDSIQGEILLGFVWIVLCHNNWTGERYGYINNLYVEPARRGRGLSDELLLYAESWFRERGVSKTAPDGDFDQSRRVPVIRAHGLRDAALRDGKRDLI